MRAMRQVSASMVRFRMALLLRPGFLPQALLRGRGFNSCSRIKDPPKVGNPPTSCDGYSAPIHVDLVKLKP